MEIERKFLVGDEKKLEEDFWYKNYMIINQFYLFVLSWLEIRFREIREVVDGRKREFYLTIKVGKGMIRKEVEIRIPKCIYKLFLIFFGGSIIIKLRREFDTERFDIIWDKYMYDDLEGLSILEVEFETEKDAENFIPYEWFGREVTHDDSYKNKNLYKKMNG